MKKADKDKMEKAIKDGKGNRVALDDILPTKIKRGRKQTIEKPTPIGG